MVVNGLSLHSCKAVISVLRIHITPLLSAKDSSELGYIRLLSLCEASVSSAEDREEHLHPAGQIKAL